MDFLQQQRARCRMGKSSHDTQQLLLTIRKQERVEEGRKGRDFAVAIISSLARDSLVLCFTIGLVNLC